MGVTVVRGDGESLAVGARWVVDVEPTDDDGVPLAVTPTMVITLPDGTTDSPTFGLTVDAHYRAVHEVAIAGRYIGVVSVAGAGSVPVAAYVSATTAAAAMPDVTAYRDWDEDGGGSWSDEAIAETLDAEAAAQRNVCRVDAVYPADLRMALLRRVQCNLARRSMALGAPRGDAEAGPVFVPGRDPEVRRLEGPYRKLVMG